MHIVFLVHGFPIGGLATSGAANYVVNMARVMANNGHFVEIIAEDECNRVFEWQGIIVHKIQATRGFINTGRPMPTYKKLLKNICRSYWYNHEIKKIHRQTKIDIVQSVNTYGIALFRRKDIPYVIRLSDYPALWSGANKRYFDFIKCVDSKRIDEEIQFIAMKRADNLIVPSILMQRLVNNKIGINSQIVESPILIKDISSMELHEKNISDNKYFLTYGALIGRKSIYMLAQIIDKLLDKYEDMKYVIVGRDRDIFYNGDYILASQMFYFNIIRNRDRFIFMGEIADRERLFSIIKHANICILPTRVDNLPNTVLESMALGKIIVSSTSKEGTSVEQLITDSENGFLAQIDDADDLLNKIRQAMDMTLEQRQAMEEKAKERVKDLTSEKVYEKMMKVYKDTMERFINK